MNGKLIVIEGTDCSGKETQSKMLLERLNKEKIKTVGYSFPMYDTPTGKIVGGPYLGKKHICEGWFLETAPNVDSKVSSLYYAADRKYNISKIIEELNKGTNVILDRYIYSNMAHQGGKLSAKKERNAMYRWLNKLEFELLELPKPDICIFLHMPYQASVILKQNREESPDQNENDENHLKNAELAYIEVANKYKFDIIECTTEITNIKRENIKSIEQISNEVYDKIIQYFRRA